MDRDDDLVDDDELWDDVIHDLYPNADAEEIEEELMDRIFKDW